MIVANRRVAGGATLPHSAVVLFAELLFIRWIPSNIIYVGFFNISGGPRSLDTLAFPADRALAGGRT